MLDATTTWDESMRHESPISVIDEITHVDALFDDVVQRLFAAGVGIDAIVGQLADPDVAARLAQHVAELDDIIEQIRTRTVGVHAGTEAVSVSGQQVPSTASALDVVS